MALVNIVIRTILFYVVITILYRFMGKREVGRLGIVDLTVSILIAELAAISIENRKESVLYSLVPIVLLVVIEIIVAYISMKKSNIRDTLDGRPSVIINKGRLCFKEMIKQRYNLDDLLSQLRSQSIKSIEEVDYAILESGGTLSVFKRNNSKYGSYPFPLVLDGEIQNDTLKEINKDKNWLKKTLFDKNVDLNNVFYAFYKDENIFIIKKDELNK